MKTHQRSKDAYKNVNEALADLREESPFRDLVEIRDSDNKWLFDVRRDD